VGYPPDGGYKELDKSAVPAPTCSAEQAENALKLLEGRWKLTIIFHLFRQPVSRLSELGRAIPGVTQKMLIQQLRALEADGIVSRTVYAQMPPEVEYRLTASGRELSPVFESLLGWAGRHPAADPAT
jgi:DNA-binding HxlR family transcriptional regulator